MSTEDSLKPTRSMKLVESSRAREEARVLPVPTGEGTSKGVVAASAEPVIIILQEFPTIIT